MLPAKRNRSSGHVMASSLDRKEEEFTVEQVEAVIATLNDKVAQLQKDIGALKQADGSHRRATTRRMPTNLTHAKNVEDKRLGEKKIAKATRRRESKSFSHEAIANPSESLSCGAATSNASTSTTKTTTTQQQQQQLQRHALFNGQRKNRPQQPQEVNSQADDRQNTVYPNASDFALNATPPPQRDRSSGSIALIGARSIDNKEQQKQQSDRGATQRNMDEQQRRAGVSWRGIDNNEQPRDGSRDNTQRYSGVNERNRPLVVKPVTTPHRRSNLNEAIDKPTDKLSLDRDSGRPATGATKSTDDKVIKHADKGTSADETTEKHSTSKKTNIEKAKDQQIIDDHAPKVRSILNIKKSKDSNASNKKDSALKGDTIEDSKKSSKIINLAKIARKSKNSPDKNKSSTVLKQAHEAKSPNFSKNMFSKKNRNDKNQPKSQKIKHNEKSKDSIEPQYNSIKSKLRDCTKELNQLIGKVSDMFRKKNSTKK